MKKYLYGKNTATNGGGTSVLIHNQAGKNITSVILVYYIIINFN